MSRARPTVGITSATETVSYGAWKEVPAVLSPASYVRAMRARGLPTLGICRVMQVMNVVYGGEIEQHLPDALGHEGHRVTRGVFSDHGVSLDPGSLAARAAGGEKCAVKSHHHQGVREVGAEMKVTGRADDGAVEAVEDPGLPFFLGVLWHPEEDENSRVIEALVSEVTQSMEVSRAGGY